MFNKSRFALVIVFLLVLCSVVISLVIDRLFPASAAPTAYFIWPPFAFYRSLGLINRASYSTGALPYKMALLKGNDEVLIIVIFLICEIPIYAFISYYLYEVLPSEFGVTKPWHFPITAPIAYLKRWRRHALNGSVYASSEIAMATAIAVDDSETKFEDADVKAERTRVLDPAFEDSNYPLVMKNMRKVYAGRGGAGPKLAVKDVTFAVEKNITFGLLGPNGALCCLQTRCWKDYSYLDSHRFIRDFHRIRYIGWVRHQDGNRRGLQKYRYLSSGSALFNKKFDIQWEELTVGEHLYFYARLKGVQHDDERRVVVKALEDVSLTSFESRLTKGLSGGERRRLSIAIALIGNPAVVFLDEPTTGIRRKNG